jgi:hypothetical protein
LKSAFCGFLSQKRQTNNMTTKGKTNNNRLGSYLTAAVGVGTLAGSADAAIVLFADSGSFIEGTVNNGDEPTIFVPLGDGSTLTIDPYQGPFFLELGFVGGFFNPGRFTGSGIFGLYPGVSLLCLGDPIYANNSGSFPFVGSLVQAGTPQSDFIGDVAGFIGFVTPNGNEGWLEVSFNSATGLFGYYGGAVATAGEELTAGANTISAIPEPASMLGTMGLLASGLMIRRRKLAA